MSRTPLSVWALRQWGSRCDWKFAVTGVARDNLADGGAWLHAETERAVQGLNPAIGMELVPDFNGEPDLLRAVFGSCPEVLAHNVESSLILGVRARP